MAAFYLEDGMAHAIATEIQGIGHQAITADAAGRKGAPDEAHLWFATQRQWVLLTHNARDFRMLHRAWFLWGVSQPHVGILVLEQLPTGLAPQAAQAIQQLLQLQPVPAGQCWDWDQAHGWRRYSFP